MWSKLPNDCISKILEFWKPMNAHEQKIFIQMNKYRVELLDFCKEHVWNTNIKHINHNEFERYVNLWNLIVKSYKQEGSQTYQGIITKKQFTLVKVKLTRKQLIISEIHENNNHMWTFNNHYMVDPIDYREIAKNYKTELSFEEDLNERKKLYTKIRKQVQIRYNFIKQVIEPIRHTIDNFMFNDKQYLYCWLTAHEKTTIKI